MFSNPGAAPAARSAARPVCRCGYCGYWCSDWRGGHNGVENKHLQSGLLEPVVQRKVEMLVDSMYTRAGRLWVWHRPRIRSTAPCTERVLLCRILYDLPTISCIGSAIAIRLKSALMSIPPERYGFLSCFMMLLLEQDVPSFNSAAQASA